MIRMPSPCRICSGPERIALDDRKSAAIELPPYGYRWLRVVRPG